MIMCHDLHVWTSWYRLVVCDESLIILLQTSKHLAQIQGSGCQPHSYLAHTRPCIHKHTPCTHALIHTHIYTHTHERKHFKDTMLVKTKQFPRCVIKILIFKTINCRLLTLQTVAGETSVTSSTSHAVWKTFPQVFVTEWNMTLQPSLKDK